MITKKLFFLSLTMTLLALSSCKNDDDSNNNSSFPMISEETLLWLATYETEGQEINYVNASNANETTKLTIDFINYSGTPNYIDCTRNNESTQCEYREAIIGFPDEFDPPSKNMALTVSLFANFDVRIMPSNGGIVVSAGRFDDDTNEVRTESDTHFEVSYSDSYSYRGNTYEAITINTLTTENLPTGGSVPPKKLVYAKEVGIVTWDDYDGVTWNLVQ